MEIQVRRSGALSTSSPESREERKIIVVISVVQLPSCRHFWCVQIISFLLYYAAPQWIGSLMMVWLAVLVAAVSRTGSVTPVIPRSGARLLTNFVSFPPIY